MASIDDAIRLVRLAPTPAAPVATPTVTRLADLQTAAGAARLARLGKSKDGDKPSIKGLLNPLNSIQLPMRAIAASFEDAIRYQMGTDGEVGKEQAGSWFDRVIDPRYGWGTALDFDRDGTITGNKWADRAIGLSGDVLLDPTTYLTLGTGTFAGRSGRLALAKRLADAGLDEAVVQKAGQRGLAGFKNAERQALDLSTILGRDAQSGVRFLGARIPATAGVADAVGGGLSAVRAGLARTKVGDLALRARVDENLIDSVRKLTTGKGRATAIQAAETISKTRSSDAVGAGLFNELGQEARVLASQIDDDLADSGAALLEQGLEAQNPVLQQVRDWFNNTLDRLNTEFKANIKTRANYFPHTWTEKGREVLNLDNEIGVDLRRAIGASENKLRASQIGEERLLDGGKHTIGGRSVDFGNGTAREINDEMRRVFGDVVGDADVIEENLVRALNNYVGYASEVARESAMYRGLVDAGIADDVANRLVQEANVKATKGNIRSASVEVQRNLRRATERVARTQAKIDKQIDRALAKHAKVITRELGRLGEGAQNELARLGIDAPTIAARLRDPAQRASAIRSIDNALMNVDTKIADIAAELADATRAAGVERRVNRRRLINRRAELVQEKAGIESLIGDIRLIEREMDELASYQFVKVDSDTFHAAISAAKNTTKPTPKGGLPVAVTLSVYEPSEYAAMRTFLSADGLTGYAIKENGDLVSVFNVGRKGAGGEAVIDAVWNRGATMLDAYDMDGYLPELYGRLGFEEYDRWQWDPQFAPDNWKPEYGEPDVVFMRLREDVASATDSRLIRGPSDTSPRRISNRSQAGEGLPDGVPERLGVGVVDPELRSKRSTADTRRLLNELGRPDVGPAQSQLPDYFVGPTARGERLNELTTQRAALMDQLEKANPNAVNKNEVFLPKDAEGETFASLTRTVNPEAMSWDERLAAGQRYINGVELAQVEQELARQSGRVVSKRMDEAWLDLNHWTDVRNNIETITNRAKELISQEKQLKATRKTLQGQAARQDFIEGVLTLVDPTNAAARIQTQEASALFGLRSTPALARATALGLTGPEKDLTFALLADYYRLELQLDQALDRLGTAQADVAAVKSAKTFAKDGDWAEVDKMLAGMSDPKFPMVWKDVLQSGWTEISERLGVAVPDEMLYLLQKMPTSQQEFGPFLKWWNKYIQFFKTYATLSPRFHIRNGMSAQFMNWVYGVTPESSAEGVRIWSRYMKDPKGFMAAATDLERDVVYSVLATGAGQFDDLGRKAIGSAVTQNRVTNASYKAGQWVEGTVRAGMAHHTITKGGNFDEAVALIERVHFIYSDQSKFDQYARRIIPFWTFFSRNAPMQIQTMLLRPKVYNIYSSVMRNVDDSDSSTVMPSYLKERGAAKLPFGDNLYLAPDIGFNRLQEDLAKLTPEGWPRLAADTIAPLRLAIEGLAGKRLYNDVPFRDDKTVPVSGPKWALLPLLAALGGTTRTDDGQLAYSDFANYSAESLIPTLGQLERLFPQEEKNKQKRLMNTLGFLLGSPVMKASEGDIRNELYRRQQAAQS